MGGCWTGTACIRRVGLIVLMLSSIFETERCFYCLYGCNRSARESLADSMHDAGQSRTRCNLVNP